MEDIVTFLPNCFENKVKRMQTKRWGTMNIHCCLYKWFFIQEDKVVYMFHLESLCASKWLPSKGQNVSPNPRFAESLDSESPVTASDTGWGHKARGLMPYPAEVQLALQKSPCHWKHTGTRPRNRTHSCLSNLEIPAPTVDTATGSTARCPSSQPSCSSVCPPFQRVQVPAARAVLSLVGGGQVNREGATAQRTRDWSAFKVFSVK